MKYRSIGIMHTGCVTWTDSNLTFRRMLARRWSCGHSYSRELKKQAYNAACRINWWISSSIHIFIYKAVIEAGDCHGQMNATSFEKWGVKKLTSNLPLLPVFVLDNFPYHCLQVDWPLSPGWQTTVNLHSKNRHDMALQEGDSVWWDHEQKWLTS